MTKKKTYNLWSKILPYLLYPVTIFQYILAMVILCAEEIGNFFKYGEK